MSDPTAPAATPANPEKPAAKPANPEKPAKEKKKKGKDNMIETQSVKGTRDWPPELMRQRNWLFGKWRETARKFAFDEYDAPILEEEALYKRKAGEEISEQMYNFVTKDDTKVSLRPEMTPSLARLVLQKGKSMVLPARWFTICQCWRFETIQKGRKREHFQWNMDIVGSKFVTAEAELIAACVDFCKSVGLTEKDIVIKVNSRKILQRILETQGITEKELFEKVCVVVDKLDKIERSEILAELEALGLTAEVAEKVVNILGVQSLDDIKKDLAADDPYVQELESFFSYLEAYGISEWVVFSPSVVRGLAYYTGIVFEGFDKRFKSRAIFGGGRYDELLTKFGAGQPIPCCGFGFGDCVIVDVLNDRKLIPSLQAAVEDLIIPFNESMRIQAMKVAKILREKGRQVDICLDARRVKNSFSYADRIGAQRAIFVAPDEWDQGKVRVKDLRSGDKVDKAEKTDEDNGAVVALAELE